MDVGGRGGGKERERAQINQDLHLFPRVAEPKSLPSKEKSTIPKKLFETRAGDRLDVGGRGGGEERSWTSPPRNDVGAIARLHCSISGRCLLSTSSELTGYRGGTGWT